MHLGLHVVFKNVCSKMGMPGTILWHKFAYRVLRHHWPNFRHPQDISEIILSSMHKKSFLKYADYADKVKVRDYVISKGLGDILLKVYGVWKNADEIDFSKLPDKFALKPNNGSGGHFFCKDKSKIDEVALRKQMNESLTLIDKYVGFAFEPHYKHISPRIYCEELMDMGTDQWPTDYKFTCIKGKIVDIFVATERETGDTRYCTLDTNWNLLPYTKESYLPEHIPAKPKHLEEMLKIATVLSHDFDVVRVDLYEYHDKVYFSELTFSPWGGMMYSYTDEAVKLLGKIYNER